MNKYMKSVSLLLLYLHSVQTLSSDGIALLAFKEHLKDPQNVLRNWKRNDQTPCLWKGVECNPATKRVEVLNLPRNHLGGTIAPEIGDLEQLRRLGLHNNNFRGPVPSTLGNCTELRAIYLRNNLLSGSVPSELGMLDSLRVLDLSDNSLTGTIPLSLERLQNLVFLNVSNNFLSGELQGLTKFSSKSFTGNIGLCGHRLNKSCNVSATTVNGYKSSRLSRNLMLSALGTVTAFLCLALICFWGFMLYNKFDSKACDSSPGVDLSEGTTAKLVLFSDDLPYTSKEIIKKLEQLDYKHIIGAGGFGTVYRLFMDEECVFAVKKIGKSSDSISEKLSEKLFEKELDILGSIRHRNLVNLRGYCSVPTARLLITDYLSYGSLDEMLHERKLDDSMLTWGVRLNIAIGSARGLAHLHHDCIPPVIHRDIKSSNILLDDDLEARVSDFGLAKILEENDSQVTTIVAGTFGYLAPEYMQSGRATQKSDIYSFGVVLLELISGKRPTDVLFTAKGLNIVGWASAMIRQNRCLEIFDPHCYGAQLESMEAVLGVAAMCISPRPESRPNMLTVCSLLEEQISPSASTGMYDSSD